MSQPVIDGVDNQLAVMAQRAARTVHFAADDGSSTDGPHRAVRPKLTEEEKEERRRKKTEQEKQRREKAAQEREERKKRLWTDNGYVSSNLPLLGKVKEELTETEEEEKGKVKVELIGNIFDVQGDLSRPQRAPGDSCPKALILQPVDDGGHFGVGGLFTALRSLNPSIPRQYELASRMDDLHRGDAHLVDAVAEQAESEVQADLNPDENAEEGRRPIARTVSVVLMVVQSVKDRYTKMVNHMALQECLQRVQHYAKQHTLTSVHLPQIWFGVQNLDEQQVRRLLDTHLCSKRSPSSPNGSDRGQPQAIPKGQGALAQVTDAVATEPQANSALAIECSSPEEGSSHRGGGR